MSHRKERKEKNCLNCNAQLYGRYCHICGQENIEPKETFWDLLTHFVYDITHFDGKFFNSVKYLLFYPGFLSKQYLVGRRAAYLNPIRMYVFTSALFFILFFSFIHNNGPINFQGPKGEKSSQTDSLHRLGTQLVDSINQGIKKELENKNAGPQAATKTVKAPQIPVDNNNDFNISFGNSARTLKEYDSIQNSLPKNKRDDWLMRQMNRRAIMTNTKFHENKELFQEKVKEKFLHSFPQMMFISLPIVALILNLLYIRHRKTFFYVNHAIFTIHVYIAVYILILVMYGLGYLNDLTHFSIFRILENITVFAIFYYIYKSMRNFYGQKRAKTLLKYFLFFISYSIILVLLVIVFFITSLLQI